MAIVQVGRLHSKLNLEGNREHRRRISLKPVRDSAIYAITKMNDGCPDRYSEVDRSIVCKGCDGTGKSSDSGYPKCSECPQCNGTGRSIPLTLNIVPRPRRSRPFLGWVGLSPLGRRF